jgi:hypothetical protein
MSEDVAVTIHRDPEQFGEDASFFLKPHERNSTSNTREYLKHHCCTRRNKYTAMNFEVKPHNLGIHFNVSTDVNVKIYVRILDVYLRPKPRYPKPCALTIVNIMNKKSFSKDRMFFFSQVFLKKGGKPSIRTGDYEFSYQLPDFSRCNLGNVTLNDSQSDRAEPVHVNVSECSTHPYTVFVSNLDFNGTGEYCFGKRVAMINQIVEDEIMFH